VPKKFTALTVRELDARAEAFEELVVRTMRDITRRSIDRGYADRVIIAARDGEGVDPYSLIAFIRQLWSDAIRTILTPFLGRSMAATSAEQLTGFLTHLFTGVGEGSGQRALVAGRIDQPLATERYLRQAPNRLDAIGDDLWTNAREQLIEGIDKGESIDALARRVMSAVDVTEPRARTIARTESNGAMNSVVNDTNHYVDGLFGEVENGIMKEWSATHDLRTRPSHVEADGQTVDLDDPFIVGGASLQFPGDPAGPAGEVINCRCTTLTVLSDDIIRAAGGTVEESENEPLVAAADQEEVMPYDIVQDHPECESGEWAVIKQTDGELMGCHDSEESAQQQVAAIMASEKEGDDADATGAQGATGGFNVADTAVSVDDSRFVTWSGILAVEGVATGDGRQFEHNALTWGDLPMPFGWMYERAHGGMPTDKVVNVGMIDTIERGEGGLIVATGRIDLRTERGWEVASMMGTRENPGSLAGVSIDADDPEDPMGLEVEYRYAEGCELPEDDAGTLLDDNDGENVDDMKCMMPSLMVYHSGRIRAATLVDIPAFMEARVYLDRELDDPGPVDVPADDEVEDSDEAVLTAATYTMTLTDVPPASWFEEPTDEPDIGAITVTDEGRVFGYLAPANVAHRGHRGKRVTVPMGNVDYGIWMNRVTIVDDGRGGFQRLATGPITMDCGHAPASNRVTGAARTQHYDNSCSVVATARVGENRKGVWIAGAILADVTPDQVRRMMTLQLSGDWGPHREKPGKRELAGALLVPVPGFPKRSFSSMSVKHGMLQHVSVPLRFAVTERAEDTRVFGGRVAADAIAASVGRDRKSRAQMLAASVRRR
jgi:hypothetical protein